VNIETKTSDQDNDHEPWLYASSASAKHRLTVPIRSHHYRTRAPYS